MSATEESGMRSDCGARAREMTVRTVPRKLRKRPRIQI
jgi:hypothetical protein